MKSKFVKIGRNWRKRYFLLGTSFLCLPLIASVAVGCSTTKDDTSDTSSVTNPQAKPTASTELNSLKTTITSQISGYKNLPANYKEKLQQEIDNASSSNNLQQISQIAAAKNDAITKIGTFKNLPPTLQSAEIDKVITLSNQTNITQLLKILQAQDDAVLKLESSFPNLGKPVIDKFVQEILSSNDMSAFDTTLNQASEINSGAKKLFQEVQLTQALQNSERYRFSSATKQESYKSVLTKVTDSFNPQTQTFTNPDITVGGLDRLNNDLENARTFLDGIDNIQAISIQINSLFNLSVSMRIQLTSQIGDLLNLQQAQNLLNLALDFEANAEKAINEMGEAAQLKQSSDYTTASSSIKAAFNQALATLNSFFDENNTLSMPTSNLNVLINALNQLQTIQDAIENPPANNG